MFFGIIVQMMFFDTDKHKKPHIHVRYGEFKASFDIETIEILAGNLPTKQLRLVKAWMEIHKDELMANWFLVPYSRFSA